MDLGIAQRRALVLGASRGLGQAIAATLAHEGANVIAAARNVAAIEAWRDALPKEVGSRVIPMALDLSDLSSVEAMLSSAAQVGPIDILVNNSGGPPPKSAMDATRADWLLHFEGMAANLFHLTGKLLPAMMERRWGRIVTIASSGVEQPIPRLALSNGVRSAVLGWSKTLAAEVAEHGVTVNVVLPGRIQTQRVDEIDRATAAREGQDVTAVAKTAAAGIPAGRYGTAQEFADVVVFLASERAAYVTGSMIRVDGGAIRSV